MTATDAIQLVGKRVLLKRGRWSNEVFEVTVVEVSPSGERMKVKYQSGICSWVATDSQVVEEVLGR